MPHTMSLAKLVLVVPGFLAMLGVVLGLTLGLLAPSLAGSAAGGCFHYGGLALAAIWRNYWELWYLTVPVTAFVLWADFIESKS